MTAREAPLRRACRALLTRAVRGGRERGGTWGEALLGEFEATQGRWQALRWSASGLRVAWRERRAARRVTLAAAGRVVRWNRRLVAGALVLVAAVFAINAYVASVVYIPSASMDPTLRINDRVLMDRLAFRVGGLHRGDIVLVDVRLADAPGAQPMVKRVAGLPGDTIDCQAGVVRRNGTPLGAALPQGCPTLTVPPGAVYLLGDDARTSMDSRQFGPVALSSVTGRIITRVWPLSR